MSYEHDCEHHSRFISYPDAGKGTQPFCTLCEIERLRAELATSRQLFVTANSLAIRSTRERDAARRGVPAGQSLLREAVEWLIELRGEWNWKKDEPRTGYADRYAELIHFIERTKVAGGGTCTCRKS